MSFWVFDDDSCSRSLCSFLDTTLLVDGFGVHLDVFLEVKLDHHTVQSDFHPFESTCHIVNTALDKGFKVVIDIGHLKASVVRCEGDSCEVR